MMISQNFRGEPYAKISRKVSPLMLIHLLERFRLEPGSGIFGGF